MRVSHSIWSASHTVLGMREIESDNETEYTRFSNMTCEIVDISFEETYSQTFLLGSLAHKIGVE